MASTVCNFPGIPAGLTLTCDVRHASTMAVLQTISLTYGSEYYSGVVTAAVEGRTIFDLKASGTRYTHRVRTIADTVGPFTISDGIEAAQDDGHGENPVTITIDDGTDPVVGATVRITGTGVLVTKTSLTGGIVLAALDDGTYSVVISKNGYETLVESLVVDGITADTYSLTEIAIAESDPGTGTGWMIVYDEEMAVEADVPISIQMTAGPGDDGVGLDTKARTAVSDETGLVEFTGMLHGATYSVWRGAAAGSEVESIFGASTSPASGSIVVPVESYFPLVEVLGTDVEA